MQLSEVISLPRECKTDGVHTSDDASSLSLPPIALREAQSRQPAESSCHGWSANSSSPPRRPSRSQRSAVSLPMGWPFINETRNLGNAWGSSGSECSRRAAAICRDAHNTRLAAETMPRDNGNGFWRTRRRRGAADATNALAPTSAPDRAVVRQERRECRHGLHAFLRSTGASCGVSHFCSRRAPPSRSPSLRCCQRDVSVSPSYAVYSADISAAHSPGALRPRVHIHRLPSGVS